MGDENELFPESMSFEDLFPSQSSQISQVSWNDIAPSLLAFNQNQDVSFEHGNDDEYLQVEGQQILIEAEDPHNLVKFLKRVPAIENSYANQNVTSTINDCRKAIPDSLNARSNVPNLNNIKEPFGFNVAFPKQQNASKKGDKYAYSDITDKLYIDMNELCFIEFTLNQSLENGYVRVMAVFEKPENILEPVYRCPNHTRAEDPTNIGFAHPEHLIRCESENAQYIMDLSSRRHSVLIPYITPSNQMETFVCLFKFMCRGSCVNGIDRRPVMLVFTLELNGEVVGRRCIRLRVCAMPHRDKKTDEDAYHKLQNGETNKIMKKTTRTECVVIEPPNKKIKTEDEPESYRVVFDVKDKSTYEMLLRLKEHLYLSSLVPTNVLRNYHERQPGHSESNHENGDQSSSSSSRVEAPIQIKTEKSDVIDETSTCQIEGLTAEQCKSLMIDEENMKQLHSAFDNACCSSQESQTSTSAPSSSSGIIRISRMSFKRVTSLKKEQQNKQ